MTGFRQIWKIRAAKFTAVTSVLAVGVIGVALPGGNSMAANESSSSRWAGGWSTTSVGIAAASSRAIGTLRVNRLGKITIQGSFFAGPDSVLSVTGGSGKFRLASGQFRVFDLDDDNTLFVIDVRTR